MLARNPSQLIMRVHFVSVYFDGALETLTRFVQLVALLMNQAEIIMGGSIRRVER